MSKRAWLAGLSVSFFCAPALADEVSVTTPETLVAAVAAAVPGRTIVLEPGTYRFPSGGRALTASVAGTAEAPITVKSRTPLGAKIELGTVEGFVVDAAHWHFEGLDFVGMCADPVACEHALHVVGGGSGFVLRDSRLVDFNAQIKVNTSLDGGGPPRTPHGGLIERCDFHDTAVRSDATPVTKINIDTGDDWIVRDNRIADAAKESDASYAAFMKSGGHGGLFERNLVICSDQVTGGGPRLGLSFGGGGTGAAYCAPAFDANVPCAVEHDGGTMRNNVIVACDDVGIYLNKAANTKVLHNTILGTAGIDFRFATSTGEVRGNVLEGAVRDRDGATHVAANNLSGGDVPYASWYTDALHGNLALAGDVSALLGQAPANADVPDDYCGRARAGSYDLGALQSSLGSCDTQKPGAVIPSTSSSSGGSSGGGASSSGTAGSSGAATSGGAVSSASGALPGDDGSASGDDGGCHTGTGPTSALVVAATLLLLGGRRRRVVSD